MLDAQDVYEIVREYQAEITAGRQIQWLVTENSPGRWTEMRQYHPSVMDALILNKSWRIRGYLAAAKAATMWSNPMIIGFQQAMLLGRPLKSQQMRMEDFKYWKGMLIGLTVIHKLKSRQAEAESLFS